MSKTIDLQIEKILTLTEGLGKRAADAARCGVTDNDVERLNDYAGKLKAAGEECDRLRAELSVKVKRMNNVLGEAKELFFNTKKKIKISRPQEEWAAFGMADKR